MTMGCVSAKPQHLPISNPSSQTDGNAFDPTANTQLLATIGESGVTVGDDNNHTAEDGRTADQLASVKRPHKTTSSESIVLSKRPFGDETYVHNCRTGNAGEKAAEDESTKRTETEATGDRHTSLFGHIFPGNEKKSRKSGVVPFQGSSATENHTGGDKLATTSEELPSGTSAVSHSDEGSKKSPGGLAHFFHFGNHNGTLSPAASNNHHPTAPQSGEKRRDKKEDSTDDSRRLHGAPLSDQLHKNFQERLVTAQMSKTSLAGGKCLTESQRDFFRMLDDKIAQGKEDFQCGQD